MAGGNDSYTKVLLHCDGADASTTFSDVNIGGSAHTWTANGNAQVDTAASKFGGASALFDGTGDWIDTPDSADWALGSSDFTIDFWFNRNGGYGGQLYMCGVTDSAFNVNSDFSFGIRFGVSNEVVGQVCSGTTTTSVTGTTAFSSSGWHHVAFVRTGNTLKLFLDGTQEGGNVAFSSSVNDSTKKLSIGRCGEYAALYHNGWIDEFRISVGVARWTANFTPSAAAYDGIAESEGAATGVASVSGIGASQFAVAGSSSGLSSVAAIGESTFAAAGSASSEATVAAVATAVTPGVGLSAGLGSASGVITGIFPAAGSAAGVAAVLGEAIILPITSRRMLQDPVNCVIAGQQQEFRSGRAPYRALRGIFRE